MPENFVSRHFAQLSIEQLKDKLPLPELMQMLGHGEYAKKLGRCPFHEDHNPSFGIYQKNQSWHWKCFTGCGQGDEIDYLQKHFGLSKGDGIRRYRELVTGEHTPFPQSPKTHSPPRIEQPPKIDADRIWRKWHDDTPYVKLCELGVALGLLGFYFDWIGCSFAPARDVSHLNNNPRASDAWAFPMRDGSGQVIGIRLRCEDSRKISVLGSKSGLFTPEYDDRSTLPETINRSVLYILEGATDTVAALSIGLFAIGRASCLGQENMVCDFIKRNKVRRAVVVTDNDSPGLNGARKLQDQMEVPTCLWTPGAKDFREYVLAGATQSVIESSIRDLTWTPRKMTLQK